MSEDARVDDDMRNFFYCLSRRLQEILERPGVHMVQDKAVSIVAVRMDCMLKAVQQAGDWPVSPVSQSRAARLGAGSRPAEHTFVSSSACVTVHPSGMLTKSAELAEKVHPLVAFQLSATLIFEFGTPGGKECVHLEMPMFWTVPRAVGVRGHGCQGPGSVRRPVDTCAAAVWQLQCSGHGTTSDPSHQPCPC